MGGRGGGFSFPNERENWFSLVNQENEILPCGQDEIPLRGSKSTLRVVEICRLCLQTMKPRNLFRFRGFIYPGSYLLSRDLSSDYHRRADVSLPGSEWDRVGPSGYDHQVSGSSSLLCSLLTSVIICACGLLCCFCWLPLWQQADIRVAYGLLRFPLFLTLTPLHLFQAELLVTGVIV